MRFQEGSYAYLILKYIMLSGEFPYQSLYLIPGDEEMIKRNVRTMSKKGYVTVNGSAEMKTIRITKKVFPIIIERFGQEYLDDYLENSENHRFRGGESGTRQTWRKHRMGEVISLLNKANVKVWRNEKPKLILNKRRDNPISLEDPVFYDSRELKNIDKEQSKKTSFTRIIGLLMSEGGHYCVYNINNGLIKWSNQGEQKAQLLVESVIRSNYNLGGTDFSASSAIIFGKDMMLGHRILASNGSKQDLNGFELLSFDKTFQHIHYLTIDESGIKQLQMISTPGWKDKVLRVVFPVNVINEKIGTVDCDATYKNPDGSVKENVLTFFDGDIGRLKRFKQAYDLGWSKGDFVITCLDFQEEMVREYIDTSNITVKIIPSEALFKAMGVKGSAGGKYD